MVKKSLPFLPSGIPSNIRPLRRLVVRKFYSGAAASVLIVISFLMLCIILQRWKEVENNHWRFLLTSIMTLSKVKKCGDSYFIANF